MSDIFWSLSNIQDVWSDQDDLQIDQGSQDCEDFSWSIRYNVTRISFVRKLDTCDPDDYLIEVRNVSP